MKITDMCSILVHLLMTKVGIQTIKTILDKTLHPTKLKINRSRCIPLVATSLIIQEANNPFI